MLLSITAMDIKVSTYNIHSCIGTDNLYSIDRIAAVLKGDLSDVVCLQEVEVNCSPTKTRIWSHRHEDNQPALIAAKVGLKYHVFVPAIRSKAESKWKERHHTVSSLDVSGSIIDVTDSNTKTNLSEMQSLNTDDYGKFGIAILSKFPMLQIRSHYYQQYKKKTQRNAIACLIELPNKKQVWVVNTHLGCHFIGREQAQQAKELALFVQSLSSSGNMCSVILCGDFNSPPWFSCVRALKRGGLRDVWQNTRELGGTFPSHEHAIGMGFIGKCFRKLLRLDYIFLSGAVVCKVAYVYNDCSVASLASDHLPVCAVLLIE